MQSSDTTSKLLTLFQIAGLRRAAKENPARWAPKWGCKRQRWELGWKRRRQRSIRILFAANLPINL